MGGALSTRLDLTAGVLGLPSFGEPESLLVWTCFT